MSFLLIYYRISAVVGEILQGSEICAQAMCASPVVFHRLPRELREDRKVIRASLDHLDLQNLGPKIRREMRRLYTPWTSYSYHYPWRTYLRRGERPRVSNRVKALDVSEVLASSISTAILKTAASALETTDGDSSLSLCSFLKSRAKDVFYCLAFCNVVVLVQVISFEVLNVVGSISLVVIDMYRGKSKSLYDFRAYGYRLARHSCHLLCSVYQ